jgi:hypothetical protein
MHCRQYICSVLLSPIARLSILLQEAQTMGFIEQTPLCVFSESYNVDASNNYATGIAEGVNKKPLKLTG